MIRKNILIAIVTVVTLFISFSSCSDSFLKEKMVSTITQDYFDTEQGLDQLVVSTYNAIRYRHVYDEGAYMFEVGHDCGIISGQTSINEFSTSAWSSTGEIASQGNTFMGVQSKQSSGYIINSYPIIDDCNKAISIIRSGNAVGKYATNPDYAASRLSEALFNRAYALFSLNTLFGDIYIPTNSVTTLPDNFNYMRQPASVLYKLIIGDLRYAYDHLPESYGDSEFGRITKYAAAHFLAKLYLYRAQGAEYGTSEYGRNSDGTIDNTNPKSYLGQLYKGNVNSDLDSAIYFSSVVINSGYYQLETNYGDLFKSGIHDWSNEGSKEIILSAVFGNGTDNYRYGNRALSLFVGNYVDSKYGLPDFTWENETKPTGKFHNNDWGYDVFTDKINDSRYQNSFHLEYTTALQGGTSSTPAVDENYYAYKDNKNTTYTWTEPQSIFFNQYLLPSYKRNSWAGRKAIPGEHKMGTGDLAVAFLENTKETAIDVSEVDAQPFVLFARWMKKDGKYYYRPQIVSSGTQYSFVSGLGTGTSTNHYGLENTVLTGQPGTTKYNDPNRSGIDSHFGTRDVPVFRLAETYLIRAEAYGRKGDYQSAINDINKLRYRASFKPGDIRDEVLARLYSGHQYLSDNEQVYPYTVVNNTYEKIKVDESYWDGKSEKSELECYPPSANTNGKRFIEFIYNEYAREFNEEEIYYEGLHHSGLQAERIQWHNQLGANLNNTSYQTGNWDTSDNITSTSGQNGKAKGNFQNYMTLKPFSTSFLNELTDEKGNSLTDDAKRKYQNYGYNL